ncbi:MAG: DNA primase [Lachnospiraceae bacterium]|nr:DNA primase [Lachnospiraceae bacterium]
MWFTPQQKDEILSRTDIVDVIGSYVNLKRSGRSFMGLCPFHNEKTPSFSVNPDLQIYKCFGCNASGNVITFLMEYDNMSYSEAINYLGEKAGVQGEDRMNSESAKKFNDKKNKLFEINKQAATYFYRCLKSKDGYYGYKYLRDRGLTDETIIHFGLGFAPQNSTQLYEILKEKGYDDGILMESKLFKKDGNKVYGIFWNRVMFPIFDRSNHVIGFGGRVMSDAKPKYLNSLENDVFSKRKNLFAMNFARKSKENYFILCEGYMDVISLHQAGFTTAVASLGTALTEEQAREIKRYADNVYLTYDSDDAGQKAAIRGIPILRSAGLSPRVINMEPYKDPDEFIKNLGSDEFKKRIDDAMNGFFFECEYAKKRYRMSDPDERANFIKKVAHLIADLNDEVVGESYIKSASVRYSIDEGILKNNVRSIRQSNAGMVSRSEKRQENIKQYEQKNHKLTGINKAYALVLSWLLKEPEDYGRISKWIGYDDFVDEEYREVAKKIFEQLEANKLNPASIIGEYEDAAMQQRVSSMLQTDFDFELPRAEREVALNEMVTLIKRNSVSHQMKNLTDVNKITELAALKKKLEKPDAIKV